MNFFDESYWQEATKPIEPKRSKKNIQEQVDSDLDRLFIPCLDSLSEYEDFNYDYPEPKKKKNGKRKKLKRLQRQNADMNKRLLMLESKTDTLTGIMAMIVKEACPVLKPANIIELTDEEYKDVQ